jgi:hypothetical protein
VRKVIKISEIKQPFRATEYADINITKVVVFQKVSSFIYLIINANVFIGTFIYATKKFKYVNPKVPLLRLFKTWL